MHRHAALAYMMATALAAARTAGVVASGQPGPASPLSIDAFVFDSQGRPVADLRPDQFAVTVDGSPRHVTSARYVHRGPGAEAAARGTLRAGASQGASLFEPSRTILVVVDETSFPRGAEKSIAAAADRLLDRFGPSDHVALVTVPMPADAMAVSFANDRVTVRDTLRGLVGRATPIDALARTDDIRADPPVTDVSAASSAASGAAGVETTTATKPVEESRQAGDLSREQIPDPNERREHPLETLTRLLAGLRVAPGPKTVVLVTAGLADIERGAAAAVRNHLQAAEAAAIGARAVVHVLGLPAADQRETWNELDQLSGSTGGEVVRVGRNVDQALDRLGLAVSGSYHLELDATPADRDGRTHAVKVTVTRPNVVVRFARRYVRRDDPPFLAVFAPPVQPMGARDLPDDPQPVSGREPDKSRRRGFEPDPEVDTVVARSAEYLTGYFREFRNVVAEEDYTQMNLALRPAEIRRMKSDFLLVTAPDGKTWVPFRDVFEVDGKVIRDREDRLRKLFLESPPADAMGAAARVQDEGSRYNLVSPKSNVNVPTLALTFLLEPNIGSFQFRRGREETVEGVRTLRVDFEEPTRPTVISSPTGVDVPASGSFWIDPLTGRIIKTFLRATRVSMSDDRATVTAEITVVFHRSDSLGLWVPAEMREAYRQGSYTIEGRAIYSNFRSFQVRTEQEIKVVKSI